MSGAPKQLAADQLLERADLAAERRLRDVQPLLTLRFGQARLRARVYWPAAASMPTLSILLPATEQPASGDLLGRGLCAAAASIVLALSDPEQLDDRHRLATLEWGAEHGAELGADAARLVIVGQADGGGAAARLAIEARDRGWPTLLRHVLVHPEFGAIPPPPRRLGGIAPATIVTAGDARDEGGRHAARLRQAGIDVTELRHPRGVLRDGDRRQAKLFTELAQSVRGSS